MNPCYEAEIEESEKAGNRRESNPGQDTSGLSRQYSATESQQPTVWLLWLFGCSALGQFLGLILFFVWT